MARMRVKNFGPIRDGLNENDGWIEFKRVTAFIGNQGSGKSTLAKLFATFAWIEKALVRGDYEKKWFERKNRLQNQFLKYHRLEKYLSASKGKKTSIEYEGSAYHIRYQDDQLRINEAQNRKYYLPQVMYVPAERNFISYVRNTRELRIASDSLKEFLTEFDNAKNSIRQAVSLPINKAKLEYDKLNDILNIEDNGSRLRLMDASSGFQSSVPLYLVSKHLSDAIKSRDESQQHAMSFSETERFKKLVEEIFTNDTLTQEQRRIALSTISSKFNNDVFINIVEEPEQNLFPSSQWEILSSLLCFNNEVKNNCLVLTTHSPYIVNYLSIAVQGWHLKTKIAASDRSAELLTKLGEIIDTAALVDPTDLVIYQSDEQTGQIIQLKSTEGIPTDRNYLNQMLREGNLMFDRLLELEEEV